ncbi:MAG: precorrin-6y C5,15-methyltransferase (decarboxylating) subunit CbiE [Spirochaetaceae bacterium]|jgi:precorrin-6Y C5,15-methyltransferase (decarboxylating)|nr:precorrin-6y C5,15-methyltransferase (decarboxylating) subunit CbiE [Spirochaetaceae bacterium]
MDREIYLVGMGPGGGALLTREAEAAIAGSRWVLGAPRLLEAAQALIGEKERQALADPEEILRFIEERGDGTFSVLLSGDPGFYSGARKLIGRLEERGWAFRVVNGVSSLVYFAGRLAVPWEDLRVVSLHGRRSDIPGTVAANQRTFFLTDRKMGPAEICAALKEAILSGALPESLRVSVGERLSYSDERIRRGSPGEFAAAAFDPLSVVLVENPAPRPAFRGNYSLGDEAFIRGEVPMTKEEVRTVVLSKLRLEPESVAWDIGAGTGSVSCEMALRAFRGRVYAVEQNPQGVSLIEQNRAKLGISNLEVRLGVAPEALGDLPPPDRVFIGGSSGRLDRIIASVTARNPRVRLVITAVTLETLTEAFSLMKKYAPSGAEFVQIAAARGTRLGAYTLMKALDPVYIISGGDSP